MEEMRAKSIRKMNKEEIEKKYADLREELMRERGISAMGGAPPSPGKIESLRRQIARMETVLRESEK
ncbi:MAG: 50S ribosomal protein L29 [Thermoplasmata archaeon]